MVHKKHADNIYKSRLIKNFKWAANYKIFKLRFNFKIFIKVKNFNLKYFPKRDKF